MDPLWQSEMSTAGSKAAVLAHRDTGNPSKKGSESELSSSSAGYAIKKATPGHSSEREVPPDVRNKALLAATGAMAGSRRRADSAPVRPADDRAWVLSAAAKSRTQNPAYFGTGDPGFEASRIQNIAKSHVDRQMYTSNPPVSLEVEEKNRQDVLHASAVAMAQKIYAVQQCHVDDAKGAHRADSHYGAIAAHKRGRPDTPTSSAGDSTSASNQYYNLEEAARKLARERLAKLHDGHTEYRSYYGQQPTPTRSRLLMRFRRRASSDGQIGHMDEAQSKKIRSQMSLFQSKLAEVDEKKRESDRDALLAVAQKNVAAHIAAIDDKVFRETGKVSPAQMELWEQQARERAQADSDARLQYYGKVHIGGGKYIDRAEIEATARARLQITLDEISEKAERQRSRDEEIRHDEEKRKRDAETEKLRAAEAKVEMKRTRGASIESGLTTMVLTNIA